MSLNTAADQILAIDAPADIASSLGFAIERAAVSLRHMAAGLAPSKADLASLAYHALIAARAAGVDLDADLPAIGREVAAIRGRAPR